MTDEELLNCPKFQTGRSILWDIYDLREFISEEERILLRELKSKLEKYKSFTDGQMSLLKRMLRKLNYLKEQAKEFLPTEGSFEFQDY